MKEVLLETRNHKTKEHSLYTVRVVNFLFGVWDIVLAFIWSIWLDNLAVAIGMFFLGVGSLWIGIDKESHICED